MFARKKNTIELATKRFKPDESTIQTLLVLLSSNQAQNPEQPIPEPIPEVPGVILSNSRPRSLKTKRPNKKVSRAK